MNPDQQKIDALQAELDRLHAGEESTEGHDPAIDLTDGQWLHKFNQATPDKRLQTIHDLRTQAARGYDCFLMGHQQRLDENSHAWVALARIRDVIADMENITGARHWARILRTAIDDARTELDAQDPREHCGNLKPPFSENTERTECVLSPGHRGSHADQHGARWWWTDERHEEPA